MTKRLSKTDIVNRLKSIYKDEYDYSLFLKNSFIYLNSSQKIPIICPKHGVFEKSFTHLLEGKGCQKCALEKKSKSKRMSTVDVVNRLKDIYEDNYAYNNINYVNNHTKLKLVCKEHGPFTKDFAHLLRGQGCPKCHKQNISKNHAKSFEDYKTEASKLHKGKYIYLNDYVNSKSKITIICPKHGEFKQEAESHLQGHGCPICGNEISNAEEEIFNFISDRIGYDNVFRRDRSILANRLELDIYVPKFKTAIEFNGIRWHSEMFQKNNMYHLNKLNKCNELGIKLIQIFEDEWYQNKEAVLSKIAHIFHLQGEKPKIYARKCIIKEINENAFKNFLLKNSFIEFKPSNKYLGCFYENSLIGVMGFSTKNRKTWTLDSFVSNMNYNLIGVGGKIFSSFTKIFKPETVETFCDRRWDDYNNIFAKINFKLSAVIPPDYTYYNSKNKYERIDKSIAEADSENTFYKIWDCGKFKYVWVK